MAFNCTSSTPAVLDRDALERTHSQFGDNYSVNSRSHANNNNTSTRNHNTRMSNNIDEDEPEADYDDGATDLYRRIENKDWDGALNRLEKSPIEIRTWVSRREYNSSKTRWRLLPIHAICIFRAPLALIEALLEQYEDGAKMKDDQGMLPLHLACRNGASKGVVMTLLNAFPDSINVRDRKGRSPIDLVRSSSSANKEAVLAALKKFQMENHSVLDNDNDDGDVVVAPKKVRSTDSGVLATARGVGQADVTNAPIVGGSGGVGIATDLAPTTTTTTNAQKEVDYEHRTVLFRLILKKEWKPAAARAGSYADEASTYIVTKGFNGNLRFLPLHKACVLQPPEFVIGALLEAFPEGARSTDQDGWLPIHCACFYGADELVIASLLKANPKGAQYKDDEGRLPLHYACLKGASQGVVDVLLETFSKGAMSKDEEGRLPIHHACGKGAPEGVIDALLKASPKGAQSKDDQGRLALHHACRKNASERVVRTLLRVYPRASQIKDDQDKLPIHYACQNAASAHVVSLLLATYPESVNVQNGFGYTPLGEAKAVENPKMEPVVRLLEKTKREQDKIKAASGETAELESKLTLLESKITQLDKSMAKVVSIGKEMRHDLLKRGKDPAAVLEKFADRLIELGNANGDGSGKSSSAKNDKTPLKSRQATPIKSLFGRKSSISPANKKQTGATPVKSKS